MLVYDVGYGSFRRVDDFVRLLRLRGVEVVVDVRAFPRSRIPGFGGDELSRVLAVNGVEYVWLGDRLGGFRRGGYESYVGSSAFMDGFNRLVEIASKRRVCLLCLERDRRYCHRRFIVERLERLGFTVRDLVRG